MKKDANSTIRLQKSSGNYKLIKEYKRRHGTSGKETYLLFEQSGASQYIIDHYDALHTAGIEYTLDDIDGMLQTIAVSSRN